MVDINLIRWRSMQRHRDSTHLIMSVFVVMILASYFVWQLHFWSQAEVSRQVQILNQETIILKKIKLSPKDKIIKTSDLSLYQQQYSTIKQIILSHHTAHQLFEVLDGLLPPKIMLTEMHFRDPELWIKGVSLTNYALSEILDKLSQLTSFNQPQLSFSIPDNAEVTEHLEVQNTNVKHFTLHVLFNNDIEI